MTFCSRLSRVAGDDFSDIWQPFLHAVARLRLPGGVSLPHVPLPGRPHHAPGHAERTCSTCEEGGREGKEGGREGWEGEREGRMGVREGGREGGEDGSEGGRGGWE